MDTRNLSMSNTLETELEDCNFETERLKVAEWHSYRFESVGEFDLPQVVQQMLTEPVTRSLPEEWHGEYTAQRAIRWIDERNLESTVLLAVERVSGIPVGLLIIVETDAEANRANLRIGYLLGEPHWGAGLGSELLQGFLIWCQEKQIPLRISAGVSLDNPASIRVLERCGFVQVDEQPDESEVIYQLEIN